MAETINLKPLYRGDDYPIPLAFTKNGEPEDITGWKIYFTVKHLDSDTDDDAVIKYDITDHSDPTNGKSLIFLTNGETGDILPGKYVYDIQYKKDNGTVKTIMKGKLRVLQDVTKRED